MKTDRPNLTLVPLAAVKVDAEIVQVIRDMLTRAEAGELASVAIVAATHTSEVLRFYRIADQQLAMLAGLQLMLTRLSNHMLDNSRTE